MTEKIPRCATITKYNFMFCIDFGLLILLDGLPQKQRYPQGFYSTNIFILYFFMAVKNFSEALNRFKY